MGFLDSHVIMPHPSIIFQAPSSCDTATTVLIKDLSL